MSCNFNDSAILSAISSLSADVSALSNKVDALSSDITSAGDEIAALKDQNVSMRAELKRRIKAQGVSFAQIKAQRR